MCAHAILQSCLEQSQNPESGISMRIVSPHYSVRLEQGTAYSYLSLRVPVLAGILSIPINEKDDEEIKKRVADAQVDMKKHGWDLGMIAGVVAGNEIRIIYDNPLNPVIPEGSDGYEVKSGIAFRPRGGGDLWNLDKITCFIKRGGNLDTIIHEIVHALNNLTEYDWQELYGLTEDQEHGAKNALACYLIAIWQMRNPDARKIYNAWHGFRHKNTNVETGEPLTEAEYDAIQSMAMVWGIKAPGLNLPPPRKPGD